MKTLWFERTPSALRRLGSNLFGLILVMLGISVGRLATWLCLQGLADIEAGHRLSGYYILGLEFHGWQMYAVPVVYAIVGVGLLCAGVTIIFRRRDS